MYCETRVITNGKEFTYENDASDYVKTKTNRDVMNRTCAKVRCWLRGEIFMRKARTTLKTLRNEKGKDCGWNIRRND